VNASGQIPIRPVNHSQYTATARLASVIVGEVHETQARAGGGGALRYDDVAERPCEKQISGKS
jgi:hypothetical protein